MPRPSSPAASAGFAPSLVSRAPQDEQAMVAALRELREADGRSIRALSTDLDIPASTLGGFFSGRHIPTREDTWRRLLAGFGVTDDDIVVVWAQAGRRLASARRRRARTADGDGPDAAPD